ncbi:hypothetical protein FB45DRAFT_826255 [Roridomyces roridus]|uniref:SET domain-containing protein n=1 Tax=Roridomyces roridus TaxID=1738132 RepID=A0AAD7FW09_9AGAR|nr:hypothetical protein FB45DRAFT_826255 [Roridomyces roridus]
MDEHDTFSDAKGIVKQVYEKAQSEFRVFKAEYASAIVASLPNASRVLPGTPNAPATPPPLPQRDTVDHPPPVDLPEGRPDSPELFPTTTSQTFIESYDCKTGLTTQIPCEVHRVHNLPPPAPQHEYVTPANRNFYHGDDPHGMPFMPFLNDPTFDHDGYADRYRMLGWAPELTIDPDVDSVVIETARRLRTEYRMSYEDIDKTGVLPYPVCDRLDSKGVTHRGAAYRSRRRDFLPWPPGVPNSEKALPEDPSRTSATPTQILTNLVKHFCTNLNCIVGYCSIHLEDTPMPLPRFPIMSNDRMAVKFKTNQPCGDQCFLSMGVSEPVSVHWSDEDFEFLKMYLPLEPDTMPCDLAQLCRRPCFEAFYQRGVIFAEMPVPKPKGKGKGKAKPPDAAKMADLDSAKFTPGGPCCHGGPCDGNTECTCYLKRAYCQRWCRCDTKCLYRSPGCKCRATHNRCGTEQCPCFFAKRECDPEICVPCVAKDAEANICQNASIQQGRSKRTKVGPSQWGRGLFMAEDAEEGELILEYVGELIFEATADSRAHVATHRQRNYLHQLNETVSVDGLYLANASRFINHDRKNPNCKSRVMLVNGEHRIGIYARRQIKSGEELLFNYGKVFFDEGEGHEQADPGAEEGTAEVQDHAKASCA